MLHSGGTAEEEREKASALAREAGIGYCHLGEFGAAETLPLLPPNPVLQGGLAVLQALISLGCTEVLFLGNAALAAQALEARRCGSALQDCRVWLHCETTRPLLREREGDFPSGGRADLAADALELRALTHADGVFCSEVDTQAWLQTHVPDARLLGPGLPPATLAAATLLSPAPVPPSEGALPTVSVCIPFFEHATHLKAALASLAAQKHPALELILVNDGSRSPEALQALARLGQQYAGAGLRVVHQDNAGPAAARNRAAREARGDCLVFCDSDNLFAPGMLAVLARALACSGADAATCGFTAFREDAAGVLHHEYRYIPLGDCPALGLVENCLGDTNFIIRRELFLKLGGFPADNRNASEDWQFLLGLVSAGHRLVAVPELLFSYRLSDSSHSHRQTEWSGASAALADTLAAAPAAWRAAWPHLAGLVRQPAQRRDAAEAETLRAAVAREHAQLLASERSQRDLSQQLRSELARLDKAIANASRDLRSGDEALRRERETLARVRLEAGETRAELQATHVLVQSLTEKISALEQHQQSLATALSTLSARSAELEAERDTALHEGRVRRARLELIEDVLRAREKAFAEEHASHLHREQAVIAENTQLQAGLAKLERCAAELEAELRLRRDKIRRMEASASWLLTTPLRALRRLTLDRWRRKAPADGPTTAVPTGSDNAAPAAPSPRPLTFHFAIDTPRSWKPGTGKVAVRGWCFAEQQGSFAAVRARIGTRLHEGRLGLARPDLLNAFPSFPQGTGSGFLVEVQIHPGEEELCLELLDEAGTWHCFHTQRLGFDDPGAKGSYTHWLRQYDSPGPELLAALRTHSAAWPRRPRVSLLMPVYNTPEKWLRLAVASVQAQTYTDWELCIANDASPAPHVRPLLDSLAAAEPRLRVVHLETNGHICRATNAALELATGELCALLDHDDELAPHALHCLVSEFLLHPDAELVYSDEDKIDEQGQRFDPHFKPDWNPELLASQNYICHLAGLRTERLRSLGGLRPGLEGSQDWDLFLRLSCCVPASAIRHIPRVLYHWRAIDGSTALRVSEKDYISESARRALLDHFARLGVSVDLSRTPGGHWHVRWPLPDRRPLVSLIIPTRNGTALVRQCITSLLARTLYQPFEILLVDNRSDDPAALAYFEELSQHYGVRVLRYDAPFNYPDINNFAAAQARGEVLCLLNNDIEVISPDWLGEMVAQALRPEIGAVGARLYYPDETVQHAGVITGLGGVAGHAFKHFPRNDPGVQFRPHLTQNLSAVTAACLVLRRSVYEEVGGLNGRDLAIAFNDVDFCLKIQARGYRNVYAPAAELFHHESASRGAEDTPEKIRRFQGEIQAIQRLWGDSLLRDPAYNPNFSLDSEDFSLAYPPRTVSLLELGPKP